MNTVTQALVALAISRMGLGRRNRLATLALVVSATIADLDCLSYFAGAEPFLKYHRALLHSLPVSACLVAALAAAFVRASRQGGTPSDRPALSWRAAVIICGAGVGAHLLLDLCDSVGVQLLWPFWKRRFAFGIAPDLDPWVWLLLLSGLLLPLVFRLASEEIGSRKQPKGPQRGAAIALALLSAYFIARGTLRARAVNLLMSREYGGSPPLRAGAFPQGISPLEWRGVLEFEENFREITVSFASGAEFDPERATVHYKPEPSAALAAAAGAPAAKLFLNYAAFPFAGVEEDPASHVTRVDLRDLRFSENSDSADDLIAWVELAGGSGEPHIVRQGIRFAGAQKP